MKEEKAKAQVLRKINKKDGKKGGKKGKKGEKDEGEKKPRLELDFHMPPPPPIKLSDLILEEHREDYSKSVHKTIKTDQWYTAVRPCLIKEVLNIPEASTEVRILLESSNLYMLNKDYKRALNALIKAKEKWLEEDSVSSLKPEVEIFFEISMGQVFEETNNLKTALKCFMKAKSYDLYYNHPDKAFSYSVLGWVLIQLEMPKLALKCFLKAREIREFTLGGDTVDTASTYNNIGVAMLILDRNEEANAFFELSFVILDTLLGAAHERTLWAKENFEKSKQTFFDLKPKFPQLWYAAVPDPMAGMKKKKKKKKKGKKKK